MKREKRKKWKFIKGFCREIKYWFIAEYKIVRKLIYALSRKNDEAKIRKAFDTHISTFTDKFGYDKGMERYYIFTSNINNALRMEKRLKKIRK